ncbi:hypothetical protein [Streptomyces sp. H39-C1]|uniref:hypothetical protein n=1 Tax=Streptomyces sp. H39-C1 TaxID=3004355 RepID=UPI0022AEEA58|nr:hypothetical protein [Streptomyces sp. H39-C1]MCZ4103180.1 hypothetical protein [Streptomyces sp. H39-C1]
MPSDELEEPEHPVSAALRTSTAATAVRAFAVAVAFALAEDVARGIVRRRRIAASLADRRPAAQMNRRGSVVPVGHW